MKEEGPNGGGKGPQVPANPRPIAPKPIRLGTYPETTKDFYPTTSTDIHRQHRLSPGRPIFRGDIRTLSCVPYADT